MAYIFVFIWAMVFITIIANILRKNNSPESNISNRKLLRYKTLDEARKRFKEVADSGEVNYFTIDDIDRIIEELKDKE